MTSARGPLQPLGPGRAVVTRAAPPAHLAGLVRHYWSARWDVPDGAVQVQRVLTYPSCNLVVETGAGAEGMLYGPVTGLSTRRLAGRGTAFGVLLQPAAGALLSDVPMPRLADSGRPAAAIGFTAGPDIAALLPLGLDGDDAGAAGRAHGGTTGAPEDDDGRVAPASYARPFEDWLAARLPDGADPEGALVNRIAEEVEADPALLRVRELAARFEIGERTLQRLVRARLGLTPKWLIQRRRLQEAAARLADGAGPDLARLAHSLDYADQAHFSRDFSAVTGMSPGRYLGQLGTGPATR
ncbi:helix-turn-helix domain-containing protein [Zafaria sp. Z1313]|uniref:helix-turn-helix domain-containing protein n=1 Tax=unclassified Zafaria TaxID=2828765 RepID=UPI002E7A96F0|nr:helix-turn-helix domain-containing protein [Zafaria sp. J156]MEE1622371.1 helix-turn-helix domain-containing protein [Zafaria sp. J156]